MLEVGVVKDTGATKEAIEEFIEHKGFPIASTGYIKSKVIQENLGELKLFMQGREERDS